GDGMDGGWAVKTMVREATGHVARRRLSATSTSRTRDSYCSSGSVWEAVMAKSQSGLLRHTGTGRPTLWAMGVTSIRYPAWMASSRVMTGVDEASATSAV